ncbi:MAG TPA: YraN family protein [Steroidobacteraceae bacterium]|jgi:putative endonuclease
MDRKGVGVAAEQRAAALLQESGFTILLRNYNCRTGELDIVARCGEVLVIAEVRLRASKEFGGAAASISRSKRDRIVRAARNLLLRQPALAQLFARFDILLLSEPDGPIEWIKAAFDAG